ncbi:MAG: hypothetical protein ACRDSF_00105 [Pseudonocardiaceae bacterium]
MSLRTPEQLARSGTTPTFSAADVAGDRFANDGRTMVRFKNTNASARTVTFAIPITVDGQAVAGKQLTVPATTGDVTTDVFPPEYNNTLGEVSWTYSTITDVTVAVYRASKVPGGQ